MDGSVSYVKRIGKGCLVVTLFAVNAFVWARYGYRVRVWTELNLPEKVEQDLVDRRGVFGNAAE